MANSRCLRMTFESKIVHFLRGSCTFQELDFPTLTQDHLGDLWHRYMHT